MSTIQEIALVLGTIGGLITGILALGRWDRERGKRVANQLKLYARIFPHSYVLSTSEPDAAPLLDEEEAAYLALTEKYPWLSLLWPDVVAHTLGYGDARGAARETARLLSILAAHLEHRGFIRGRLYCKRIVQHHGRPSGSRSAPSDS